jgi:integration host factor subunit alpha
MAKKTKGQGLTKADLVEAVYHRHGALTKDEAAQIVEAIFGTVKTSLSHGRTVKIKNFGVFQIAERAGRVGVNPVSGEKLFIPAHKGLAFRPAARLKTEVTPGRRARHRPGPPPPGPTKGSGS